MAKLETMRKAGSSTADIAAPAAAGLALPHGAHLSLVTTLDGLAGLEQGWRRLETVGARPHAVFQTFDWIDCWARAYAQPAGDAELCCIAGFHGDALVFVWPLMKVSCGPVKVIRWASEPLGQYGDVLLAPDQHPKTWLDAGLKFLRQLRGVDSIRLRHVRDDAIVAPYLREHFRDARLVERAPWLDLSAFAGEADYEARYNPNQRKRRKKIRKALEDRFGAIRFELLGAGSERDAAIRAAIAEKSKWIEDRGRQNRVLRSCQLHRFLRDLAHAGGTADRLVVSRMTAGATVLSWEIGLRLGASHFGYITSHVTEHTDLSPARLHMDLSQRRALADGMTVFDLMVPYDPHKESWSSATMEVRDYHAPVTSLGWLYGRGYLETVRPWLRDTYHRLPADVLRRLKPLLRH